MGNIKVTDIDLFRMGEATGEIEAIYELKRSRYGLDQWSPYPNDFTNFNVLLALAEAVGARFRIVYNVYDYEDGPNGHRRNDDASRISTFSYSRQDGGTTRRLAVMDFEDFVAGDASQRMGFAEDS